MESEQQLVDPQEDIIYSRCYLYGLVGTISLGSLQFGIHKFNIEIRIFYWTI